MKFRLSMLWVVALVALLLINYSIYQKETLIRNGETIFLQLAPVDPRSLIQGDYMQLSYAIAQGLDVENAPQRGDLIIKRAPDGTASFVRIDDGATPLASDERRIHFSKRQWGFSIGAESFFFQEGMGERYDDARYAELRLAPSGETVLIGMRGEDLKVL